MKRKRFTEEQIIRILGEAESGTSILELCRKHGMSNTTLYNWRRNYGGMDIRDARPRERSLIDGLHGGLALALSAIPNSQCRDRSYRW